MKVITLKLGNCFSLGNKGNECIGGFVGMGKILLLALNSG